MNTNVTKEAKDESKCFVKELCIKNDIAVGFGWVKEQENKSENHYSIIDAQGNEIFDYQKIHPFSYGGENEKFIKGNEIKNCRMCEHVITAFICYDLRFPILFQYMPDDIDIVIVPANWPQRRSGNWKCLLQARAIENQVYILGINCVGNINGLSYSGDSCIINPLGEIQEQISNAEGIIYADIQNDVNKFRIDFPMRQDRRFDLYKTIFGNL